MSTSLRTAQRSLQNARMGRAQTSHGSRSPRTQPEDFTPSQRQQLTATSRINAELSTQPMASQKQTKTPYHAIPSRLGAYNIQRKLDHPFKTPENEEPSEPDADTPIPGDGKLFVTFDLLKTMTPRNCVKCLSSAPIFMRTMYLEGKLDPDIVSSVSLSLTQSELQKFMLNMTQEINFFVSLNSCQTIAEAEEKLLSLVPMKQATIWVRSDFSKYIVSPTTKEALMLGQTVLTEGFEKSADIVMSDPANHAGFSVDYDLPLLRGIKSMLVLPISGPSGDIVAVLQCCGFQNALSEAQTQFTDYYVDVLKIARDIIQKKLFSNPVPRTVPSNIGNIFSDIDKHSVSMTATHICKYLQSAFPCEAAELFEFDEKYRCLVRLTDGVRLGEAGGGISFQAALSSTPINLPNCQAHPSFNREIDGKFVNKSILTKAIYSGRERFVVTLRAKPTLPSFMPRDVKLLQELGTVICDAIKLSKWLEAKAQDREKTEREMKMLNVISESLHSVAVAGTERWEAVKKAAKDFFDCDTFFVCLFDGRYMKYTPSDVKCKFEECPSGTAFNYRETVIISEEDDKFNAGLYRQLGVECKKSLSFPYRCNGRVAGAIEVINPKKSDITSDDQKLFCDVCACLTSTETKK